MAVDYKGYHVITLYRNHTYEVIQAEAFKVPSREVMDQVLVYLFPDLSMRSTAFIPVLPGRWMYFDKVIAQITPMSIYYSFESSELTPVIIPVDQRLESSNPLEFINYIYSIYRMRGYNMTIENENNCRDSVDWGAFVTIASIQINLYDSIGRELKGGVNYVTTKSSPASFGCYEDMECAVLMDLEEETDQLSNFIMCAREYTKEFCTVSLSEKRTWKYTGVVSGHQGNRARLGNFLVLHPSYVFNMFYLCTPMEYSYMEDCHSGTIRLYTYHRYRSKMQSEPTDVDALFDSTPKRALVAIENDDTSYYDMVEIGLDSVDDFIEATVELPVLIEYTRFVLYQIIFDGEETSDQYRVIAIFHDNHSNHSFLRFDYQITDYKDVKEELFKLLTKGDYNET